MTPALIHQYPVRVEPHLTDYAGAIWHGSYLRWLEEARIDALRQCGMEYSDLVDLGCDLPVVKLELNYRQGLRMGDRAVVQSYIARHEKVRMVWSQNIHRFDENSQTVGALAVEAGVTVVPVSMVNRKIMRRLPEALEKILTELKSIH